MGNYEMSDLSDYSPYWETDEFEDLVTRSLIGMYESKIKKNKGEKSCQFTPEMLQRIRMLGCYFPSNDRIISISQNDNGQAAAIQEFQIECDGRPYQGIVCSNPSNGCDANDQESMRFGSYLEITYFERLKEFPKPNKCDVNGRKYRLINIWYRNDRIEGICNYFVMTPDGKIVSSYRIVQDYDPITGRCNFLRKDEAWLKARDTTGDYWGCEDKVSLLANVTLQFYQDRKYLWNVLAKEGIAKATFAVHPEQVKSLFYSRELPMTDSGRKRPILHWVKAHQRRMKEGIEFDVKDHLRGTSEFVYNGTKFEIINPFKERK